MGNICTQSDCVDLRKLPVNDFNAILNETYTVQRNPKTADGIKPGQPGAAEDEWWKIRETPHSSGCSMPPWITAHATNRIKGSDGSYQWRFFLDNGFCKCDDDRLAGCLCPQHACGWRRIRTFWPTRLKTQEEREAWWLWLEERVSTLSYP
jgi:hypothetical protein